MCCLALTAGVRSGVGVLVHHGCPTLKVVDFIAPVLKVVDFIAPVLLLLQLGKSVVGAHNWWRGLRRLR